MTDIEQARTILTKWGEGATPGPWQQVKEGDEYLTRGDITDMGEPGNRLVVAEHAGPDATLIVAMTDPELREALDGLLAYVNEKFVSIDFQHHAERIATVIIAIDQRMNA